VVRARHHVSAGAELTISYSPPSGITSLDFLTSWGFTCGCQPLDLALPLIVHALPPIHWDIAVAAAAAVSKAVITTPTTVAAAPQHPGSDNQNDWKMFTALGPEQWQTLLLSALSSLPVQIPAAGSDAGTAERSKSSNNCSSPLLYAAAAQLSQQYGCFDTCQLHVMLRQHGQDQRQQMTTVQQHDADGLRKLHAYLHEQCSLEPLSAYENLHPELRVILKAAVLAGLAAPGQGLPVTARPGRGSQHDSAAGELALQHQAAMALYNECQGQLLQCSTTIDDDMQLLMWLQQEQPPSGRGGFALAGCSNAMMAEDEAVEGPLLQEFQTIQTDVMRQLMALQAVSIVRNCSSSSSSSSDASHSSIGSSFVTGAAQRFIDALKASDACSLSCNADEHCQQHRVLQHIAQMQLRQASLLQQMRRWQGGEAARQQQRHQRQQEDKPVTLRASLCTSTVPTTARCQAALAARLQHKQLLMVTGRVCLAAAELCHARLQS